MMEKFALQVQLSRLTRPISDVLVAHDSFRLHCRLNNGTVAFIKPTKIAFIHQFATQYLHYLHILALR